MAQLTNSSRTTIRPYRSRRGDFSVWSFEQSTCISTAAIRYGDVVQFDVNVSTANNRIVKSSTMAAAPNVISTAILGIALEGSTDYGRAGPTTSTAVTASPNLLPVCLADSATEFLFPTKIAGADHTSTLVGTRRAIGYDSSLNIFYLDTGNSTAGDATTIITEVIDPGTTNGLVAAKFLSTNTARFVSGAF